MKIVVPRATGPTAEPELLLRFVMKKCREVIEQKRKKLAPIWMSLALAAVHRDQEFYNRLKQVVSSSSDQAEEVLSMCKDVFLQGLDRLENGYSHPCSGEEGEYPCFDECACRPVLSSALSEGKKMLTEKDYEFINIFEALGWIGLQCYPMGLYQFEAVCQSRNDDPKHLLENGIEIIKNSLGSSREER